MRRSILVTLALAATTGCGAPRVGSPLPVAADAPSASDLMTAADTRALGELAASRTITPATVGEGGYRIGPDDLLDVRVPDLFDPQGPAGSRLAGSGGVGQAVTGAPAYQQGLRVSGGGDVSIPTLGLVHAAGLTPTELENEIGRRLMAAGILRTPKASVQVAEYRSGVVAVIGSVEGAGVYHLSPPRATLTDMLWAAGGPSKDAGRLMDFTVGGSAATTPIRIDLALLGTPDAPGAARLDAEVRPGDVLNVAPAGNVLVDGWVEHPGSYQVTRGLTLGGAIAAAGGNQFSADRQHTVVRRVLASGGSRTFEVDLEAIADGRLPDVPIADGDVVYVPASVARVVPWGMWTVAREMIHVGGSVLLF